MVIVQLYKLKHLAEIFLQNVCYNKILTCYIYQFNLSRIEILSSSLDKASDILYCSCSLYKHECVSTLKNVFVKFSHPTVGNLQMDALKKL